MNWISPHLRRSRLRQYLKIKQRNPHHAFKWRSCYFESQAVSYTALIFELLRTCHRAQAKVLRGVRLMTLIISDQSDAVSVTSPVPTQRSWGRQAPTHEDFRQWTSLRGWSLSHAGPMKTARESSKTEHTRQKMNGADNKKETWNGSKTNSKNDASLAQLFGVWIAVRMQVHQQKLKVSLRKIQSLKKMTHNQYPVRC